MTGSAQVQDDSLQNSKRPKVGGWLLLLCIGLTVFAPVASLMTLLDTRGLQQHFEQYSLLYPICLTDTILSTSVTIFSIYVGIRLWTVKPNAVRTAKLYLLCLLAYRVFATVLPFFAGLPPNVIRALIPAAARTIIRSLVFATIWLLYLSRSKRVRNTYSV